MFILTMLNNIANNCEKQVQHNVVATCFLSTLRQVDDFYACTRLRTLNLFPIDEYRIQQCRALQHMNIVVSNVTTILDENVHGVNGVQYNIVVSCFH